MHLQQLLLFSILPYTTVSAETVVGAFIFHRHGDRTAKAYHPVNLTTLGYRQVYLSGQYYRNRYVATDASSKIYGINSDIVKQSQISASSPDDDVLMESTQGFLQGLYPPVGSSSETETLRNGSTVDTPLDGYQLIPVDVTSSDSDAENANWLQGSTSCGNAEISSNEYYYSDDYNTFENKTEEFYKNLTPILNSTFSDDEISYENAYSIYDYLNVAMIHNTTFNSSLLSDSVFYQLRTLADHQQWHLAYNASSTVRAIDGASLAGEILSGLNDTITSEGSSKLNVEFGSYGTFFSFFGLAHLQDASTNFTGIADYASSMVFELVTNTSVSSSSFPSTSDIKVRFLFHNGTVSNSSEPVTYPLFGQEETLLPWSTFARHMSSFAITDTSEWCTACGNSTGTCAAYVNGTSSSLTSGSSTGSSDCGGGMSNVVAGVIGALVTLAVILGVELLFMLVGGFRLVSKKNAISARQSAAPVAGASSAQAKV